MRSKQPKRSCEKLKMKSERSKAEHISFARSRSSDLVLMLTSLQLSLFQRLFITIRFLDLLQDLLDLAMDGRTMAAGLKRMFMHPNMRTKRATTLAKVSSTKFDESVKNLLEKVRSYGFRETTMTTTFARCKRKKQLLKRRDVRLRRCD